MPADRLHLPPRSIAALGLALWMGATGAGIASPAGDLCLQLHSRFDKVQTDLTGQVAAQKRELQAWISTAQSAQGKSPADGFFDLLTNSFWSDYPPRVLADVNQNIGALACLTDVFVACGNAVPAEAVGPGPQEPGYPRAFNAVAGALASTARSRADSEWQMAQDRKAMFAQTHEIRWGTEANQMMGYAEQCRTVVTFLADIQLDETQVIQPGGAAQSSCPALLERIPDFCILPPGDGEEADWDTCCQH